MGLLITIIVLAICSVPVGMLILFIRINRIDEREQELTRRVALLERELQKFRAKASPTVAKSNQTTAGDVDALAQDFSFPTASSEEVLPKEKELLPNLKTPTSPPLISQPGDQPVFVEASQSFDPLPDIHPQLAREPDEKAGSKSFPWSASSTAHKDQPAPELNLEQFLGVKMFAWLGGLILFLGIAFFVKYSFDHNLIPPVLRVMIGIATGLGLGIGGILLQRKEYKVTSDTLLATGVVALYASIFAAYGRYHLIGMPLTFATMSLITCVAFILASRLNAQVVAILGMVGGFLTPPLLSAGVDRPLGLFSYITFLDVGLLALAIHKRWVYLGLCAAIGTVLTQLGWYGKFYDPNINNQVGVIIFGWFNLLFAAFYFSSRHKGENNSQSSAAAVLPPIVTFLFCFYLAADRISITQPIWFLGILFLADIVLLAIATKDNALRNFAFASGFAVFGLLGIWIGRNFTPASLGWFLFGIVAFAALHSFYPIWLKRRFPEYHIGNWSHLFPALGLLLMFLPIFKDGDISILFWAGVLVVDLIAFAVAIATGAMISVLALMVLTTLLSLGWVINMPIHLPELPFVLLVVGVFGIFFFSGAIFLLKRQGLYDGKLKNLSERWEAQLPALSCIMPFLLLCLIAGRFEVANPASVFALAAGLVILLLGLLLFSRFDAIALVSLFSTLALEFVWHESNYAKSPTAHGLGWYFLFYALFTFFPFLFQKRLINQPLAWVASALSGPLHFFLIYKATTDLLPGFEYNGLIPGLLTAPPILGLWLIHRKNMLEGENKVRLMAWFGGSALFFITLIFPIQLEKQWLTIAWALEGAALIWLFKHVPYPKMLWVGVALLVVTFCRLSVNGEIISYYPRSGTPIFNWHFYTYGIAIAATLWAAHRLRSLNASLGMLPAIRLLYTFGTILAFLLLNIEIADYFSTGSYIRFQFGGSLGRDMTYSIAWAAFALALLAIGLLKGVAAARYASIALLGVTLAKLFLHDLSELGQLHRIGAFIGVAIILIVASFLYQRFLAIQKRAEAGKV